MVFIGNHEPSPPVLDVNFPWSLSPSKNEAFLQLQYGIVDGDKISLNIIYYILC